MSVIWTPAGRLRRTSYESEADLEAAILQVQTDLFGPDRLYLDVKKKIGVKGVMQNIPDGYLIDLTSRSPRLYVVENELAAHDPLRHVAVQILQFSLSFEAEPRKVKMVLFDALQAQPTARKRCEEYAARHNLRNLDNLLDHLVHEVPFAALVIIDEIPDNLENVLLSKFRFAVEVAELARYEGARGDRFYRFTPFLEELAAPTSGLGNEEPPEGQGPVDPEDIDTVVVPARQEGFQEVFLGENCWRAVRIGAPVRPKIKYVAAYQVAPESAITHVAPVQNIEPWKDSGKLVLHFAEPAKPIGPIRLNKNGRITAPQNLRYTTFSRLQAAKTLDDLW